MDFHKGLVCFLLVCANAHADQFMMSMGADYSSGDYGSNDATHVTYVPWMASYETGRMTYKVTLPWIRVSGPGDIIPSTVGGVGGGSTGVVVCDNSGPGNSNNTPGCSDDSSASSGGSGGGASTATSRKRTTESGLGDVVASVGYNMLNSEDWVVDVTGRVKFGTASRSRGLGTGKEDYALQVNVDKYFGSPYVSLGMGYRWLGEPRGVDFNNVTYGSLGAGYKVGNAGDVGVSYDWATAAVDNGPKPQEVSIYASYRFENHYKLSGVLYTGLSNASPDAGAGVTLAYYF